MCDNKDRLQKDSKDKKTYIIFLPSFLLFPPLHVQLDDDNQIEQMEIFDGFLYINTLSHLYRVPLERCSRYLTCQDCAASRDPYCVWNTDSGTGACERSTLNATVEGLVDVPSK